MHENSQITENGTKTRLGKRLEALVESIESPNSVVYDLCCDHGAVGRAVLELMLSEHVVFNDIHPDIVTRLGHQLSSLNATNYELNVQPAEQVSLQLVDHGHIILAGVGDEQCIEILKALFAQPASRNYSFVISPATKTYFVRRFLQSTSATLLFDRIVTENRRSYEIIGVQNSSVCSRPVSSVGEGWEPGNAAHQQHLKKLIDFYSAQLRRGSNAEVERIVEQYQNALDKLFP